MTDYSAACASRIEEIEREASEGRMTQEERAQALRFTAMFYAGIANMERDEREKAGTITVDDALVALARAIDDGRFGPRHNLALFALAALAAGALEPLHDFKSLH